MVKSTVFGSLAYLLVFTTSCGDPKSKSTRTEVNSADAIDDYEDIVAERPAVISGSHLFCSEEQGVMGEDSVDVICSIKEDVEFEKYVDKDHLVIEVAGKVVPITIDDKGKFKFSLPKGQEYTTESIKVHDIEEIEEDASAKEDVLISEEEIDDESPKSDTSEEPNDKESLTSQKSETEEEEQILEEMNTDPEEDEEEDDDSDKSKNKDKDKKSKRGDSEEEND